MHTKLSRLALDFFVKPVNEWLQLLLSIILLPMVRCLDYQICIFFSFSLVVTFVIRFKVHISVMDDSGLASFILFDCLVSNFIGKFAKNLVNPATMVGPFILLSHWKFLVIIVYFQISLLLLVYFVCIGG